MFEQFSAANAFEEGEPQQQVYVGHQREGMLGELRSQFVGRICNDSRHSDRGSSLLQEIADEFVVSLSRCRSR